MSGDSVYRALLMERGVALGPYFWEPSVCLTMVDAVALVLCLKATAVCPMEKGLSVVLERSGREMRA